MEKEFSGADFSMPAGWHMDETGAWLRDVIHHMGRRCRNWDYCGTGCYLITLVLNDRKEQALGRVEAPGVFSASELGAAIEAHARRIPEFSPGIDVQALQMMPDHLHLVLRVKRHLEKPMGEHLRGFKIGCTKLARALGWRSGACSGIDAGAPGASPRGAGLFADGFTDTILGDGRAVAKARAYLKDNPRRLWEKRLHPDLFRRVSDLEIDLGEGLKGHFMALGNRQLLALPHLIGVQCARRDFAYARGPRGELEKEMPPAVCSPAFEAQAERLLAAGAHGAVLVSPCISHGEKEIARRAFAAGCRVIALRNKGFGALYKPGGRLFDICAAGRLLLLAPAAWPFVPGEKPITRIDACVLNRIAQLLCGSGAAEINYHGLQPLHIDSAVTAAIRPPMP